MLTPDTLPPDLPWQGNAYLLLDGISVKNLRVRLLDWFAAPDFQLLYANTPLVSCNPVSPCLITLKGPSTPGLSHYLAHSAEEWGYLIFSHASAFEVITHLRTLLDAQYPHGQKVWLRVADPAVMHALLKHAEDTASADFLGRWSRWCCRMPSATHGTTTYAGVLNPDHWLPSLMVCVSVRWPCLMKYACGPSG